MATSAGDAAATAPSLRTMPRTRSRWSRLMVELRSQWILYLMVVPGIIYFLIFRYVPILGTVIAFKDYSPRDGIWGSAWVGFQEFREIFESSFFFNVLTNTLLISGYRFAFGIPAGIALAILINEVRIGWFKKSVQTITYLPHFLSWVVIYGVVLALVSTPHGLVNKGISSLGVSPIQFLGDPDWFRTLLVSSGLWKEVGWSAIIYLAALANVSPDLYEAASVDGASRLRKIWDISLPSILPVVALVSLLNLGSLLSAGFEQVFLMYNPGVYSVGDIIDTWVYRQGIEGFQFSTAAAVGLFKGLVGFVLIVGCNSLARRTTGKGILW